MLSLQLCVVLNVITLVGDAEKSLEYLKNSDSTSYNYP